MIAPWLEEVPLQQLFAATKMGGGEARAVGGCVRDFLMGYEGMDVDIASTLTPAQTIEIAARQQWKAVPTGIEHGTVTLVLPNRVVEVTTLRRDVETDGRHAKVAFTDSWEEDAARRDFTINAMSMNEKGVITDFFDGQADCKAQRIRFIGDADARIKEDGLRILRYFRFLASHGKPPADAKALAAISTHREMLRRISGERIANEMRKLLMVKNPSFALRLMAETGVANEVFGCEITPTRMIRLSMLESQSHYQASVWARVVVLTGASQQEAKAIAERWKLSRHEAEQLRLLAQLPAFTLASPRHVHTRLLRLHGAPAYLDWLLGQAALQPGIDIAPYVSLAHDFTAPKFPVTAADLMAHGMVEGKALGDSLAALEKAWEDSDYMLGKDALLSKFSKF